jgi:dephospho-CoA kinase
MIKIGLTGNMGSGKSTVAKIFSILGVPIFYADIEAKKVLDESHIIKKLCNRFGNSIIDQNNKVNRKSLSSIVFQDQNSLDYLNKLVHPEVARAFDTWLELNINSAYIIHEAAILYESGFNQFMDKIIYVYAPEYLRIDRIIERDKLSKAEISERMNNQWDDQRKIKISNHVIENGLDDLLIPQVLKIHHHYQIEP